MLPRIYALVRAIEYQYKVEAPVRVRKMKPNIPASAQPHSAGSGSRPEEYDSMKRMAALTMAG